MPPASKSASSAAQPLSTPTTPAPPKQRQPRAKVVKSECEPGTILKNLNIFKNGTDPVAKEAHEYPDFLWSLLDTTKTEKKVTREKNRAVIKRKNFFSGKL